MIAVTGYSGFVGKHLLSHLNTEQCVLLGRSPLDSSHRYFPLDLAQINLNTLKQALKDVQVFIHLAAHVHVMGNKTKDKNSEALFDTLNHKATIAIAEQAAKSGVKRFVFLSTIKVNGEHTQNRAPFTYTDPYMPVGSYAVSKAKAEKELLAIGKRSDMEIVIIRPPLVYGKGVKANFNALVKAANKHFPLPLRLVNNKRSLVSVYNLIDLISVCIHHPKAVNQVFLVSDDNDLSSAQLFKLITKQIKKINLALPIPIWLLKLCAKLINKTQVFHKLNDSLQVDITHTKETLDWSVPYTVEQALQLSLTNK